MLTQEQLNFRKTGIGSSEIAAIAGLDKYRTALDVYAEKLGLVESFTGNRYTEWGELLEPVIAEKYAQEFNCKLITFGTIRHKKYSFAVATPDRIVVEPSTSNASLVAAYSPVMDPCHSAAYLTKGGMKRVVEIKTADARLASAWGKENDSVPENYLAQCAWLMAVTDLDECDLVVLIGGNDFRVYRLKRDIELERHLLEIGARFWHNHILARVPPEIDGSDSASEYLSKRFPKSIEKTAFADENMEALVDRYKKAKLSFDAADAELQLCTNKLKNLMQDTERVVGSGWSITWKSTKNRAVVNWEAIAKSLKVDQSLIDQHTTEKTGNRPFSIKFFEPK